MSVIDVSLSLQAGHSYTLQIPTTLENDGGFSPYKGTITYQGKSRENHGGFWLENTEVGKITKIHTDKVAINYKHILPVTNVIWFYAYTGERVRMSAVPMVVHSHESIVQGGPAYGTYFSYVEDSTKEES